jgi:hypothetical protein
VTHSQTDDAAFEGWVNWVFDHPVAKPGWYWNEEIEPWTASPVVILDYISRLFEEAPTRLAAFSEAQVGQGLWFLAFGHFDDGLSVLWADGVLSSQRERCLRSIYLLFEKYLAVHT